MYCTFTALNAVYRIQRYSNLTTRIFIEREYGAKFRKIKPKFT